MGTRARSTLNNNVYAWSTFNSILPGWAGMVRGKVFACALSADWVIGTSKGLVARVLAVCALGEMVEMEAAF
jgi:hypothetical protein